MYHVRFKGRHDEIGYRYGESLAKHGLQLLSHVPFSITQERRDFASLCVPIYQKFFPEILEEIRGLAEGQRCDHAMLQAVLLSMYAIPPACHCSCFAVADEAHILLCRNSDFLTELEKQNTNVIYRFSDGSRGFTGNTTAFVEVEDGVNESGLAVGMTSVYPVRIRPGFNAGMLLRFFLEKCQTVQDVLGMLRQLPIGSAQTITAADAGGHIALIECNSEKTTVMSPSRERPYVCATNAFHADKMPGLQDPTIDNWQAEQRYDTLDRALKRSAGKADIALAKGLLSGKEGFLCQYDRSTGRDTVWSVIYDLKEKAIYRAEGNPGRKSFVKDKRFTMR